MIPSLKDLFFRNQGKVGLFLTGVFLSLTSNPHFLIFLSHHPYLNMVISAITMGLMAAGWMRTDKEHKILQLLRKSEQPTPEVEDEVA